MAQKAWKFGWLVHQFGLVFPLTLLFLAAFFWWAFGSRTGQNCQPEQRSALGLLFALAVAMALVPVVAKQYFAPHLLPAWLLMSIPASTVAAIWLQGQTKTPLASRNILAASVGLGLSVSVVMAVNSWYLNGDVAKRRLAQQHQLDIDSRIAGAVGSYGYVLGVRPEFYFFNGIIPASDVLYPGGLAGAGTPVGLDVNLKDQTPLLRAHTLIQAQAEKRLMSQFLETPPAYIFLVDRWARARGSTKLTDVVSLNRYVSDYCVSIRIVHGKPYQQGVLYRCSRPVPRATAGLLNDLSPRVLD